MEIAWNKLIAILGVLVFIVAVVVLGRRGSKKGPAKPGDEPPAQP